MRKLLVLTCALMLVSSMAFGARKPASATSHSPADLVAFPDAGKFWVGVSADRNINRTKPQNGKTIKYRDWVITPSVEYAINNKFAVEGKFAYQRGKYDAQKNKVNGLTNPTFGVVYRAIDCASSKQALNVELTFSPTIGKHVTKTKTNARAKNNAISGKNVVGLNVAYARPVGPVVLGADAGITYNGKTKTKTERTAPLPTTTEKQKSQIDFNVGLDVQYKGINKLALTAGVDFTRIGKEKADDGTVNKKAYNQVGVGVDANYNVAKNVYVALNYDYAFNAQPKDGNGQKLAKVGTSQIGLTGTFQF